MTDNFFNRLALSELAAEIEKACKDGDIAQIDKHRLELQRQFDLFHKAAQQKHIV